MPPRGLDPRGLILVDKPPGPSSFEVIARIRRRTRRATGHAGTLDPFATGLLLVLSGAATRLAPWLVGLDKRYLTDVDLSARTSTGDPEGEVVEETRAAGPGGARGAARRPARRGRAADPGRLGGEDRRRARLQAAPARRRRRDAGAALAGRLARPDRLRRTASRGSTCGSAAGRTSARSRTRSAATAGRSGGTEVGPFSVDDADDERILPPAEALPWLPAVEVSADEAAAIRGGRAARRRRHARRVCDGELVAVGRVVMPA